MAVSGKIADGVIKIALAGLEVTKAQLQTLQVQTKKLGEALGTIGSASSRGFAVATGGVTAFLKAADPVRFEIFSQKLQILAMYIGLSFIPILDDAIATVDRLIDYFRNLSDDQREQIVHWTQVGLGVLAFGTAIGGVVTTLPKLIALLRAVQVIVGILMSSTGVGLVVALAGAAVAVLHLTGGLDKLQPIFEKLQAVFAEFVGGALGPLMDTLAVIGGQLAETFGQLMAELAPVFASLAAEIGKLVQEAIPVLQELAAQWVQLVGQVVAVVVQLIPPLAQILALFVKLYVTFNATLAKVWLAIAQAVVSVLPALAEVIGVLAEAVATLAPVFTELATVLGEVLALIAEMVGEVMKLAGEAIADLIRVFADLFKEMWKAFGPTMVDAIRLVVTVAKGVLETIRDIVKEAKALVEVLDSLNPFSSGSSGGSGNTGAGDWANGSGSAGGPYDFGGGNTPRGGGGWMDRIMQMAAGIGSGVAGGAGNRFTPMARPVKVENFGLEDAFKKAQQGASFDPMKLAENERKRLMQEQLNRLGNIDRNTARRPGAEMAR